MQFIWFGVGCHLTVPLLYSEATTEGICPSSTGPPLLGSPHNADLQKCYLTGPTDAIYLVWARQARDPRKCKNAIYLVRADAIYLVRGSLGILGKCKNAIYLVRGSMPFNWFRRCPLSVPLLCSTRRRSIVRGFRCRHCLRLLEKGCAFAFAFAFDDNLCLSPCLCTPVLSLPFGERRRLCLRLC